MKTTQKKSLMLLASVALILALAVGSTLAILVDKSDPVENVFVPTFVPPDVVEDFDGDIKSNVQIHNGGNIPAYIRAAIVVNWVQVDKDGKVTGIYGVPPVEDTDYAITIGDDWIPAADGYYYYEGIVAANDNVGEEANTDEDCTSVLIESVSVKADADIPEDYQLSVEILAQSVQAEGVGTDGKTPVQDLWGEAAAQLVGAIN